MYSKRRDNFAVISEVTDEDFVEEPQFKQNNHKTVASPYDERLQSLSESYMVQKKNIKELAPSDGLGMLGSPRHVKFKKRPKSAMIINKKRKIERMISSSNKSRFETPKSILLEKGVRDYTTFEKFFMKTIYQIF